MTTTVANPINQKVEYSDGIITIPRNYYCTFNVLIPKVYLLCMSCVHSSIVRSNAKLSFFFSERVCIACTDIFDEL